MGACDSKHNHRSKKVDEPKRTMQVQNYPRIPSMERRESRAMSGYTLGDSILMAPEE